MKKKKTAICGEAFLCCAIGVASRMADPMQASKHFAATRVAVDYSAPRVSNMKVRVLVLYILCFLIKERRTSQLGSVDVSGARKKTNRPQFGPMELLRPSARNEILRG